MPTYLGFGLQIDSDLSLPGFVEGEAAGAPRIRLKLGPVPLERWHELNDDGMGLVGVARGVMKFQVQGGDLIVVEPEERADLDFVRAIVSGELMSALLRQRGFLVLHASCVARGGEAVGFVGHSGWGKSTLASHFTREGYRLLSDDVLAIRFEDGDAIAMPGYPQVKLREDAGTRYADAFTALQEAHSETDKRLVSFAERFQEEPVRIIRLYVLEPTSQAVSEVVSLPRRQAFLELTRHTRASNLIKSREFLDAHLVQVTQLMEAVPVRLLRRERSLDLLPELYESIERDLRNSELASHLLPTTESMR